MCATIIGAEYSADSEPVTAIGMQYLVSEAHGAGDISQPEQVDDESPAERAATTVLFWCTPPSTIWQ
jgi:hypothetical protein